MDHSINFDISRFLLIHPCIYTNKYIDNFNSVLPLSSGTTSFRWILFEANLSKNAALFLLHFVPARYIFIMLKEIVLFPLSPPTQNLRIHVSCSKFSFFLIHIIVPDKIHAPEILFEIWYPRNLMAPNFYVVLSLPFISV